MQTQTENNAQETNGNNEFVADILHLKKSFGNNEILKDINFKLKKGENLIILGKSGSGKSVLIKCMVRLLEPDEGKLIILGKDISEMKDEGLNEIRKKVGFLFQSAALYDSMTVRENLEFPLRELSSMKDEEVDTKVTEALQNVGLAEAINKMPSELSGGMRKRIGLARTLILHPAIILYDEPTTGLDPITAKEISNLIINMQKKYNAASIIITHDIACAKIVADRLLVLRDGIFAAEGTFEQLEKSQDQWIQSFIHS
jgi:phospholipid/cholesterol/gamma-HCH transport system ATP-binding protein